MMKMIKTGNQDRHVLASIAYALVGNILYLSRAGTAIGTGVECYGCVEDEDWRTSKARRITGLFCCWTP